MTIHTDITPTLNLIRRPHGEGLELPAYETKGAAGMDLRAAIDDGATLTIAPWTRVLVPTGFIFEVPEGFEAQIRPRSGLAFKHGITCLNSPGTIDSDYRGEVKVLLANLSEEPFEITRGMRIAQMVIAPVMQVRIAEIAEISETTRGAGGFGSTGV
ncbi:dUTP diphosphatase [Agrobacterium rhizogenes]|jgi:dUTP pyrophosphatase|uniref:Deoxyuridine 5'-triphosphate nucleotidohydrolase n=2 Tax=unclassified Rhizobium TaxID=2613769 RepID=A0AAU7SBQ9_9HYPH|nr:dUTP diphosphatase [Rhizobium rhizogenes]NTJ81650.1 dUTP diphosphatase [Rhizobium rhizogenes]